MIGVTRDTKQDFNEFKENHGFKSADKAMLYLLALHERVPEEYKV